jgi:hypothetical protein
MFRLTDPSSGQIQNIVLVHSVGAHIMGSHIVYKIILTSKYNDFLYQYNFVNNMGYHNVCTH